MVDKNTPIHGRFSEREIQIQTQQIRDYLLNQNV